MSAPKGTSVRSTMSVVLIAVVSVVLGALQR
jgi:hypothetical protein